MLVIGVDTGTKLSAYTIVDFESYGIVESRKIPNPELLQLIRTGQFDACVIEMFSSYGNRSGSEVYESIVVIGEIKEACHNRKIKASRIYRKDVKKWICHTINANDGDIKRAIEDRFGVEKTKGKLKADTWQAYALTVAYIDMIREGKLNDYEVREIELEVHSARREKGHSKRPARHKIQD